MEKLNNFFRPLFMVAFAVVTVWSYLVPDAKGFMHPDMARIFFWHFPCPMIMLGAMFTGIAFSFRQFRDWSRGFRPVTDNQEQREWDVRAESAMELGFIFSVLTMLTGILFSLQQWGALWQWDPRQTSFLLALLIYFAYFVLRSAIPDPDRRASTSAAYALSTALPILFLVLIFPRLPQIAQVSFHPTNSIMGGQIKGAYAQVIMTVLILVTILSVWLYRLRVSAGMLALRAQYKHGKLENRGGGSAPTAVVRPISLPGEG